MVVESGRVPLKGTVEIAAREFSFDVTAGLTLGQYESKLRLMIAAAAQVDGQGIGLIRMASLFNASEACLDRFAKKSVEPGSIIHTAGRFHHDALLAKAYRHVPKERNGLADAVLSLFECSLTVPLKTSVQDHIKEFVLYFNCKTSFNRLARQAVAMKPLPSKVLRGRRMSKSA